MKIIIQKEYCPDIETGVIIVSFTVRAIFNGTTNVRFKSVDNPALPNFENIPHFIYFITGKNIDPIIVDTGFSTKYVPGLNSNGIREDDQYISNALKSLGYSTQDIRTVIMTHMHWDHTGGIKNFPGAVFYVQGHEFMTMLNLNPNEETYYCPNHWIKILDRFKVINGDLEIAPGIKILHTGSHTSGHQAVEVETENGKVLLAGDEPFNYDKLWEMVSPEYWEKFRNGPGRKYYWVDDIIKKIEAFVSEKGIHTLPTCRTRSLDDFKKMGYRVFYAHDVRLEKGIVSI